MSNKIPCKKNTGRYSKFANNTNDREPIRLDAKSGNEQKQSQSSGQLDDLPCP